MLTPPNAPEGSQHDPVALGNEAKEQPVKSAFLGMRGSFSPNQFRPAIGENGGSHHNATPYLKPNRLNDVVAALQMMGLNNRYRLPPEEWAERISGDRLKADYWSGIFGDHPEFFRKATENPGHYALVVRRALPRRYDPKQARTLTYQEFSELPQPQKDTLSRPPVSEVQLKLLLDTAINLHKNAIDAERDWRWWVTPVLAFVASFGGALLALWVKQP
jgi:hypothetical protein